MSTSGTYVILARVTVVQCDEGVILSGERGLVYTAAMTGRHPHRLSGLRMLHPAVAAPTLACC